MPFEKNFSNLNHQKVAIFAIEGPNSREIYRDSDKQRRFNDSHIKGITDPHNVGARS